MTKEYANVFGKRRGKHTRDDNLSRHTRLRPLDNFLNRKFIRPLVNFLILFWGTRNRKNVAIRGVRRTFHDTESSLRLKG